MRYGISKAILGFKGFIPISENEYIRIKNARNYLFEAYFLEEKLDFVTENYNEYETELLSIASRIMVFHSNDYFEMNSMRNLISRRIINVLTVCRMYLDQSIQHINNIYGDNSEHLNILKTEISFQYDSSLGYRTMEELRNYVQHKGFPIQNVKYSYNTIDDKEKNNMHHLVIPMINTSILEKDVKIKKSVLNELNKIAKKNLIDVRPLIREYVQGIGKIHEKVRELISMDLVKWEKTFDDTVSKFKDQFGNDESIGGLAIAIEHEEGYLLENYSIFTEFIERRKALERKNRLFGNLQNRYASNEIQNKDV